MLIMMLPVLIPLIGVVVIALVFIQWLIWVAQEEEEPRAKVNTVPIKMKARKLSPVSSPRELNSIISEN